MLATLAEPPLSARASFTNPSTTASGRSSHVSARDGSRRSTDLVAPRQRKNRRSSLRSCARSADCGRGCAAPSCSTAEIVALDAAGPPGRLPATSGPHPPRRRARRRKSTRHSPSRLIAFDLLRDGDEDMRGLPLTERRARLEKRIGDAVSATLRISEQVAGDGRALDARARAEGWEGLIVKDARSPYQSGRRSPAWRKLKLLHEQEFVVGGWTEPRQTRQHFGALLLACTTRTAATRSTTSATRAPGSTGGARAGVEAAEGPRERDARPSRRRIKTNEPAHWVRPDLVAQVRFTEWTV